MNQAVPEELLRDLSIRGFDALFEPAAGTGSNTPLGTTSINGTAGGAAGIGAGTGGAAMGNTAATWTLRAASEKLGLSPNTVRKRIRTGELRADKIIGLNGPEWRIQPPVYSAGGNVDTAGGAGASMLGAANQAAALAGAANQAAALAGAPAMFPSLDAMLKIIETQAKQLEVATTQLEVSTEQVKAATRVIAYQQLQLEEKDNKVKLLTDSRHGENWLKKLARQFKRD